MTDPGTISTFIRHHFRHFNASAVVDATYGYRRHLEGGARVLLTLAAMSTIVAPLIFAAVLGW